ncbi:MAG: NAD-dependent epimerase/dehydratase family protein [Candidatus Aureabacteria bacterium]|nr:NAD-dependent epimerase/dehydratase family protein [Candidatus Auribacterota bacterium]
MKEKPFSCFVTGACGFIGRRLSYKLLQRGAHVTGLDTALSHPQSLDDQHFHFISGNLSEKEKEIKKHFLSAERSGNETVFHAAAISHNSACIKDPARAVEANVMLTEKILEFCRKNGVKKLLFLSTGLAYGEELNRPAKESDPVCAFNFYCSTKLAAEKLIEGYAEAFGMTGIVVRLSNAYGPGMNPDTVTGTILKQIADRESIHVKDWMPVRDFIFAEDVVEGLIRLSVSIRESGYHLFNLSTGTGSSIRTLGELASGLSGLPLQQPDIQNNRAKKPPSLILDNHRLIEKTGWEPKYSLKEGMKISVEECRRLSD